MSSNAMKTPLLRLVASRSYSAQAAPNACPAVLPVHAAVPCTTTLPNKLIVSSLENNSPISRVSVLFRAGSRYEEPDNLGATHTLRIAAGLGTCNSSQFGILRNIQQVGGNLSATTDRETVAYTLETKRDALKSSLQFLGDVVAQQEFKPWELSDNIPRLKYELASLPPQVRALDLLHKAAYRSGLGNSLFCPTHRVGKISSETLDHYVSKLFTTNRAAIVGVGVDHERLVAFAQSLELESGDIPQNASKYHGGELRLEVGSQLAHVAVAVEGVSVTDINQAFVYAVLQYAQGVGPSVKWGATSASPLTKAVQKDLDGSPFAISALNVSFSDSGLFGFLASCPSDVAGLVVEAGVKQLRLPCVSEADVARGKAQLKSTILMALESGTGALEEIGSQSLLLRQVFSGTKIAACIDSVKTADVNAAARRISTGKLSLAAVGNLSCVPYLDDLQ